MSEIKIVGMCMRELQIPPQYAHHRIHGKKFSSCLIFGCT